MIKDTSEYKKFRVSENLRENTMQEFFSWVRFIEFDEDPVILIDREARAQNNKHDFDQDEEGRVDSKSGFKSKDLPALSIRNEKKVLFRMKIECEKVLRGYPTTLEEDLETLAKDNEGQGPEPIHENRRNALLMRSGEKKVLKYLIETADTILPFLDKNL